MRTLLKILTVTLVLYTGSLIAPYKAKAQVTFQVFYDGLSPYGIWVTDPTYGYVWVPNAGPDFTPYGTNGHWVLTDDGWTWVSDYDWGWAPFHYGRWRYDNVYGWTWLPDDVWGPAWVSWRDGGGCYGWTPLGFGIGIGVAFYAPPDRWLFCDQAHFGDPYISRYYLPRGNYATIYARTTIIGGTHVDGGRTYYAGPNRAEVERVTHKTFAPVTVRSSSRAGGASVSGGALSIYRPAVAKTAANGARPKPASAATYKEVKPVAQRTTNLTTPGHAQPARTVSSLPKASHTTQHTTTNVPMARPAATQKAQPQRAQPKAQPQKAQPQRTAPQQQPQRAQPQKAAPQYPAPYTVHPTKTQPAAAPQRSVPAPQRTAPQRSAPAPQRAAPQRSAPPPQRSAPAPARQPQGGGGRKPGGG